MPEGNGYAATYRDELALSRHFVLVLERKLAGRDSMRRTNVHPLDWCHLGVIGPMKGERVPVELDSSAIEAEPVAESAGSPSNSQQNSSGNDAVTVEVIEAHPESTKEADAPVATDAPAVREKGDDREGLRRPPSAIGFEILVTPDGTKDVEVTLDASLCIFTKHVPTFSEQTGVLDSGASAGAPLAEVVQRWPIDIRGIAFRIPAGVEIVQDNGVVQRHIDETLRIAFGRSDAERMWPSTRPKVQEDDLKSEAAFQSYVDATVQGVPVETWNIRASIELRVTNRPDGKLRLGCYFKNETVETPPLTKGKGLKDAFKVISDVRISAALGSCGLLPIEILPVPQDYQYDRRVWAVGHNTSVRVDREKNVIETSALAQFEQARIMTRDVVPAKFASLAVDPFPVLDEIYDAMCAFQADWKRRILDSNALSLDAAALEECNRDYLCFGDEIRRFACGVAALRADERLLRAFEGANRVFGRLARGYDSWRLFQLAFIVTQLPALVVRERHTSGEYPPGVKREWDDVLEWGDVLWFRTGGGKTEAYLGLACCAMLYDRLRGKRFGVTAWLRFPLRMLSIQQLQRAMRVIWGSEQERIRLLGDQANQSAPLRLGYFVGSTTTPNGIGPDYLRNFTTDESLEWLRVIPDCPACDGRGTVRVTADVDAIVFRHKCSACHIELPLDVSDDEVYRNLPTLIVGTIDKMASVGQQPKFGMLWGGAKWKCPEHGYAFGDYCSAFGCKLKDKKLRRTVKPYDPSPALHIQDELHLLQEELGAFAGHYETLIRHCEQAVGGMPSKVIAATATIEGFENQVRHLYGVKDARRFPGRGYDRMRSFYAEPELDNDLRAKTARIFVAFKSPSLQPADASAYCTEILHTEIGNLFGNPHVALAFLKDAETNEDVRVLLRHYSTTLNYVGSLAKGSRVTSALEEVASKVRPGARDLNIEYRSSRSSSAQVADVVHRVESPPAWEDDSFLDALVATNMISHGVDLERVNLMTMDGVPEETAEYIQASSRSGRRHIGLVVVVLANFSLRATSIYHRFLEYHQHLERMVSPVPVNRFAKYAAQRTLPGIVLGLLYGLHAATSGRSGLNLRREVVALMDSMGKEFLGEIRSAYSIGEEIYDPRLEKALGEILDRQFGIVEMSIRNSNEKSVRDAVRPAPMTSLRDVEAGVPFWPDTFDSRLLSFVQRTRD